ncbi:MAG TPA: LLM class flavin-dependent oxidoreductase [Jiangellales bacterium]|nr:LLM class flavin-dependent oxidoreductase [Jiangellales bacterium]
MKFSYVLLPDYPLTESIEAIKLADRLGFHACYAADETWHKDLWLLFAAAADKTSRIRFGPSVSAVTLREPALIAQAAATLDELTGGRAEVVLGSGNFGLLEQHGIDWSHTKALSRVKEALHIVRTFLDDGTITYDGQFQTYKGLFTFARPVQEHMPVKMGAMRGPRSFEVAGEFSDGCHHALSYTREAYEYAVERIALGADRAGRDLDDLDIAAWVVFAIGRDSLAARQAARSMVGIYASSMSKEQLERNGVSQEELAPIVAAMGEGDLVKAVELTSLDLAERMSFSGTPEEIVGKIRSEIQGTGVNHVICAVTDASLVKAFTGQALEGVASVEEQLQLIADEVMPHFA